MSAACRPGPTLAPTPLASLGPALLRRGVAAIVTAIAALAAATFAAWLGSAHAAQPHYRSQVWEYQANGEQVADVLRQCGASQGLLIQVDEAVRGEISARLRFNTNTVLDSLAQMAGLTWYYDGAIVYVYPAKAARTQAYSVTSGTAESVIGVIKRTGIYDARFPLNYDEPSGVLLVSGPPRYVELVGAIAQIVDGSAGKRGLAVTRVYTLKYAWADDMRFSVGGKAVDVPGVASILRDVFGQEKGGATRLQRVDDGQGVVQRLGSVAGGTGGGAGGDKKGGSALERNADRMIRSIVGSDRAGADDTSAFDTDIPRFRADQRLNAVIVRDVQERHHQYETLIRSLDRQPMLVEIEATIITVERNALESLGVDWAINTSNVSASVGSGTTPQPPRQGFGTLADAVGGVLPQGGVATTLSGSAARNFIARINALATKGDAAITARPRVLTIDNSEALIEDRKDFYVRVASAYDAQLFNVSASTTLRVTPMVVDEASFRRIKLAVRVEDGSITDARVDGVPVTRKAGLATQAFVIDGESLLVGGYAVDEDSAGRTGVIGLSKIPVIGALFTSTSRNSRRSERLFLITPRAVLL
ncbi:MAG: type III secretion system outer membrane ring subunit SctC [Pseudomonadota bacterium]